ncbi:unnamed protein product [Moneuplotes crassus]|uniref:Cyclic nucleotide-binding domain-containing protein n=1 Tax=Euplotes crassus TaxID=5936 RepID=A0AAD2D7P2_EUPCR|nr:unnamed protein product [Moneuplotes crassus]
MYLAVVRNAQKAAKEEINKNNPNQNKRGNPMGRIFDQYNEVEKESEEDSQRKSSQKDIKMGDLTPRDLQLPKEEEVRMDLDKLLWTTDKPAEEQDEGPIDQEDGEKSFKSTKTPVATQKMDTLTPNYMNPLRNNRKKDTSPEEGSLEPSQNLQPKATIRRMETKTANSKSKSGGSKFFKIAKKFLKKDEDKDDDESRIEDIFDWKCDSYSEAEEHKHNDKAFLMMSEEDKQARVEELWGKCIRTATKGALIIDRFNFLKSRVYTFGGSKNTKYERYIKIKDSQKVPFWCIMPTSPFKIIWNITIIFLLLWTAIVVPYQTAFIDETPLGMFIFSLFLDFLFILDLGINFISAVELPDDQVDVRFKAIAMAYIKGWFFIDATACIPFQLVELFISSNSEGGYNKLLRLARLPRLYRLMRILRIFKMSKIFKNNKTFMAIIKIIKMNEGVMKLIKVAMATLLLVHLMTCFWFLFAKFSDFDPDTWVFRVDIRDSHHWQQYLISCYWAFQTLTTVGFGDVGSKTNIEIMVCCIWMIFGVGFYSFIIGNLSSIMNEIDEKAAKLQDKINALDDFARRTKLPSVTVAKIKRFFVNNQEADLDVIDPSLLEGFPISIRADIMYHTHMEIIEKIGFLKATKKNLLWSILPCMKPMRFYEKDYIYRQQEQSMEVVFLYEGEVTMYMDINDQINGESKLIAFNKYKAGSYFGDSDIFCSQLRDSNAMCLQDVNALVLSKKDLETVIGKDKKTGDKMALLAYKRANVHASRMIDALVKEDRVYEFVHRVYPEMNIKRNTACDFLREYIQNYIKNKHDKLTPNEKQILAAFNKENKMISTKKVVEEDSATNIPTIEEYKEMEKLKYNREMAKYQPGLAKIRKTAKSIQSATLKIKANNTPSASHSKLHEITQTSSLIAQKNESIEETLYRLLVRLDQAKSSLA